MKTMVIVISFCILLIGCRNITDQATTNPNNYLIAYSYIKGMVDGISATNTAESANLMKEFAKTYGVEKEMNEIVHGLRKGLGDTYGDRIANSNHIKPNK